MCLPKSFRIKGCLPGLRYPAQHEAKYGMLRRSMRCNKFRCRATTVCEVGFGSLMSNAFKHGFLLWERQPQRHAPYTPFWISTTGC